MGRRKSQWKRSHRLWPRELVMRRLLWTKKPELKGLHYETPAMKS
jgi:hypothetical protein